MNCRTIKTCPGIGDSVWLIMKLINQKEKFHFKVGNGSPQRGKALFDLFPQLTESFEYIPDCGYKMVKRNAYRGSWSKAPQELYLEANSHLEEGRRIEEFLPDLETSFLLPYQTENDHSLSALNLLGIEENKFIGIYTSAYSNARHWNGWTAKEWLQLIRLIQGYDKNYKFVIIGANYDIGIPGDIMSCLKPDEFINTIGQPLSVVVEILKRLDCFIGFPSGLSIINETIGAKQTIMFYPKHLERLMAAWPDPERIKSGQYKGCLFCYPEDIFKWMVNEGKI